jgi:hypothetical protein
VLTPFNYKNILIDTRKLDFPIMSNIDFYAPAHELMSVEPEELIPLQPSLSLLDLPLFEQSKEFAPVESTTERYKNLKRVWENQDYGGVFSDYKPKLIQVLENEEELNQKDPDAMRIISDITNVKHELRELNQGMKNIKTFMNDNELFLDQWQKVPYMLCQALVEMEQRKTFLKESIVELKLRKDNLISNQKREIKALEIHQRINVQITELDTYEQRNNITAAEYAVSLNLIEQDMKNLKRLGIRMKKGMKGKYEKYKRQLESMREQDKAVDEELNELINQSFNSQSDEYLDAEKDLEMEDKDPSIPPPKKKQRIDVYNLHREVQPDL